MPGKDSWYHLMEPLQNKLPSLFELFPPVQFFAITDPPSPRHVFECLAVASHPNTRRAEDPTAEAQS